MWKKIGGFLSVVLKAVDIHKNIYLGGKKVMRSMM